MLSRIEKAGLIALLKKEKEEALDKEKSYQSNAELKDQSEAYLASQREQCQYWKGRVDAFYTAISLVNEIEST